MKKLLQGKNILIMGVANKWSIAWGISLSCLAAGANLILTYQNERTEESVKELSQGHSNISLYPCDVTSDADIQNLVTKLSQDHGSIDGIVHSLAFAKKEDLSGKYFNTSREGYLLAQNISSYSLTAVCREALPLLSRGSSVLTLTYLGGERAIPNYNVMGVAKAALESSVKYLAADLGESDIRVNSISAGPIKTLAAKGVKGFGDMLKEYEQKTPLKRLVTLEDIGNTALFLLSDLSKGITGENIHVDAGYHIL